MYRVKYLISSLFGLLVFPLLVVARFCEGGHICSLPRECCSQGCCPPYQNTARQIPPGTDHVLNLFFINHWYFWCVIVAIVLAILCVYSIWRKRQQFCGWGFGDQPAQSEGDSAGSCYAPPQYSRCNSFHHPPPPYTEVTAKPDLYPLVFTCNNDNAKHGASYLMVQYFRNYIVRPAGSLSTTSTIDSLSSSFICNANDANTLIPPPYSRATSPDVHTTINYQHQVLLPRSVSQNMLPQDRTQLQNNNDSSLCDTNDINSINYKNSRIKVIQQSARIKDFEVLERNSNKPSGSDISERSNMRLLAERERKFRYITDSNRSLNDSFVNNSFSDKIHIDLTKINYAQKKVPVTTDGVSGYTDINILQRSLETCCQILQQHKTQSACLKNCNHTSIELDLTRKMNSGIQILTSGTCSAVSSLANMDSPSSPPQPTSPTGEVRILLEEVRRLQIDNTLSDPNIIEKNGLSRINATKSISSLSRPATLQSKHKFYLKQNKGMYIPINTSNSKFIRSPVNSTNIFTKHRGKKIWTSLSAPTTPGTTLPSNCLEDDSPLLNEHDEDDDVGQS